MIFLSFGLFCGDFGVKQAKMLDLSRAFCYNICIELIFVIGTLRDIIIMCGIVLGGTL